MGVRGGRVARETDGGLYAAAGSQQCGENAPQWPLKECGLDSGPTFHALVPAVVTPLLLPAMWICGDVDRRFGRGDNRLLGCVTAGWRCTIVHLQAVICSFASYVPSLLRGLGGDGRSWRSVRGLGEAFAGKVFLLLPLDEQSMYRCATSASVCSVRLTPCPCICAEEGCHQGQGSGAEGQEDHAEVRGRLHHRGD